MEKITKIIEDIRYIEIDDVQWYVIKDICDILKVSQVNKIILNVSEKFLSIEQISTRGGKQKMRVININGIKHVLQNTRSIYKDKILQILNIDLDIIYDCKESSYLKIISESFKNLPQKFQYTISKYKIDLYFPDQKLAIEVDEFDHKDRDPILENNRQKYIEEYLNCKFIRFNPDQENFNIGSVISKILEHCYKLKN